MSAPITDIVERIRTLRYVHVPVASKLMAEAASAIETLRWQLKIGENIIGRLVAENGRLRLTDAEREAIATAVAYLKEDDDFSGISEDRATLRKLLARLHT